MEDGAEQVLMTHRSKEAPPPRRVSFFRNVALFDMTLISPTCDSRSFCILSCSDVIKRGNENSNSLVLIPSSIPRTSLDSLRLMRSFDILQPSTYRVAHTSELRSLLRRVSVYGVTGLWSNTIHDTRSTHV